MTRYALAFLSGAVTVALAVFFADSRLALMFALGAVFTAAAGAAAVGSASRAEAAGEFLIAISHALRRAQGGRRTLPRVHPSPRAEESPMERDLASALRNFGAGRHEATAAARQAIAAAPGADYDTLFRLAVGQARKREAA